MTMRMTLLAVAASLAVAVIVPVHAQSSTYYRWKDASGVTHYGDAPPPAGKADPVKVQGSATSSGNVPSQSSASTSSMSMAAQAAAAAPSGMAAVEQAARARNCDNAKANLQTLSGRALLVDNSDPATAKRMTPEQIQAAQRVANIDVSENCPKGAP